MDLHLQSDWQRALGQRVEIWKDGRFVRKGTVEAVMADNSLLWISAEGTSSRQMVPRYDGYQVFAHFLPESSEKTTKLPAESCNGTALLPKSL
ncbi:hypothetical protein F8G81_20575 [Arthrobacter sp. CDRTa11]|uniref:hypothetical protein n=1 Tax=Arthrobacter sp. CDRTa11 TaxID=2651199 RepID=UPI002265BBFB|nr:hypothetical protein [Arthrobacter sp. CDRTa11]UZX04726.1 hypothetical protein F8G81_20575 [Arthrobacter sp. CDRTa11]